jgi:molybdate transport system substrate-binding protein
MKSGHRGAVTLVAMALSAYAQFAEAGEIRVLGAWGIMAVMEDLGPKFERATGNKLAMAFDGYTRVVRRIHHGEAADVVVVPREGIDGFVKSGKASASDVAVLARSHIGVVVRRGAPKPDISSPEAFKRTMLAARSIAYPDPESGGPTGIHFAKMLERLGIASEMKPKTVFPKVPGGAAIASLVANGEAELGVHQIQELLPVAGIESVGLLPGELQNTYTFAAAVMTGAKDAAASKALIDFLRTPDAAVVMREKGMEPD